MIGLVYGELPFMILPLYASLEKLDRSLLEAAADLGAGGAQSFRRVTLPLTLPGLAAGTVLVFMPSLGQFVVSDLLGGARSMLLGNLIQNQFSVARNTALRLGPRLRADGRRARPAARLRGLRPAAGRRGAAVKRPGAPARRTRRSSTSSSTRRSPSWWSSPSTPRGRRRSGTASRSTGTASSSATSSSSAPCATAWWWPERPPRSPSSSAPPRPWRSPDIRDIRSAAGGPPRRCSTCR